MSNNYQRRLLWFVVITIFFGISQLHAGDPQRTKEFIVMGYQGIIYELGSSEGPYLRTLKDLLGTNPDQGPKTIDQIRSFSKTYPNIMDFAEHVLNLASPSTGSGPSKEVVLLPSGPSVYRGDRLENALNHLTRGMKVTVYTKGGAQFNGRFEEYLIRRLWINGTSRKSFQLDDIVAIDAPEL
jgi:hypothetical protein